MKKKLFKGCATALITPFTENGDKIDIGFFEKLIDFQLENDTDALVIAGTTGESPVINAAEKSLLFETAVKAVSKRVPVIAGTGSNDTAEAVKKSNDAEKKGVDGLLIVTPFYNKCTQDGLIKHYHFIADRVSTPIIVYNVPSRTGVNICPETYKSITEHKNIIGIKEANGDISAAAKTISLCKDQASVYSGNDDQTVAMMSLGAQGVISVASNIIPREMHLITDYALNNDIEKAAMIQGRYLELMQALFWEVNPIPVKAAAEMLFRQKQYLRLPLSQISEKNRIKLSQVINKAFN